MEEENNGKLAFLLTLLKCNYEKISVLVYRKPILTDEYLHNNSHHQTSCKGSVASFLSNRAYSIITTNKDDLTKENARTIQLLKENRYQESITNKIFQRITNNTSLSHSQP